MWTFGVYVSEGSWETSSPCQLFDDAASAFNFITAMLHFGLNVRVVNRQGRPSWMHPKTKEREEIKSK